MYRTTLLLHVAPTLSYRHHNLAAQYVPPAEEEEEEEEEEAFDARGSPGAWTEVADDTGSGSPLAEQRPMRASSRPPPARSQAPFQAPPRRSRSRSRSPPPRPTPDEAEATGEDEAEAAPYSLSACPAELCCPITHAPYVHAVRASSIKYSSIKAVYYT